MKTSVSLSVFAAKEGAPVLFSGASQKHISQIKNLGYDGVDLFVSHPQSSDTKEAVRLLAQHQLGVGVVMPASLAGEGLFLGSTDPDVRSECIRRINEIVSFTAELGSMVSLGLVRGSRENGEPMEVFLQRFAGSCAELLVHAQRQGVPLLIEPINRYEINTINSARQGVDFIRSTGLPLFLMLDTFHMNVEDISVEAMLAEAMPLTKHIHFLDSNRLAPSMGHLPMADYCRLLKALGYEGYLCLEALPLPDVTTCAEAGAAFFKRMRAERVL